MTNPYRPVLLALACLATCAAHAGTLSVQVSDSAGKPLADVVVVATAEGGVAMPRMQKPAEIEQRGLIACARLERAVFLVERMLPCRHFNCL